jgi:hypothetical protein
MRINKEQYDTLVAKLDALQTSTQRMASGFEQAPIAWNRQQDRLTAIEEGLDKLLQSDAALEARLTEIGLDAGLHFRPAKKSRKKT